jgi:hypothetical protein
VFHDVLKQAYIQGLFSVGDRRSAESILKLAGFLPGVVAKTDFDYYLFRKKDISGRLPWDFIDAGISRERLWQEYQEALAVCLSY